MAEYELQVWKPVISQIGSASSGITTSLLSLAAGASLESLRAELTGYIGKEIGMAALFQSAGIDNLPAYIEESLEADWNFCITAMKAGIGQGVGVMHAGLYEQLTGMGGLLGSYNGFIQSLGIDPFIRAYFNRIYRPTKPDIKTLWQLHKLGAVTDAQFNESWARAGWSDSYKVGLDLIYSTWPDLGTIFSLIHRGQMTETEATAILNNVGYPTWLISRLLTLSAAVPSPTSLVRLANAGNLTTTEFYTYMNHNGFTAQWADRLLAIGTTSPDVGTAIELLNRGLISDQNFHTFATRSGFNQFTSNLLIQLRAKVPGIGDIIAGGHKRAFGGHTEGEQLAQVYNYAGVNGYDNNWSNFLWYSHYSRIPFNYAVRNLHRGLWDTAKFTDILELLDVHPDDQADVLATVYDAPSTRELGYGFDAGLWTQDDITTYKKWAGLAPDVAVKAAQALVNYRLNPQKNQIRNSLVSLYARGKLTEAELKTGLAGVGTNEAAISLYVSNAKLQLQLAQKASLTDEGRIVSSSEAIKAYKAGLKPMAWLVMKLTGLDWTEDRISLAVAQADYDLAKASTTPGSVEAKRLALGELREAWEIGAISDNDFKNYLTALGYPADLVAIIFQVSRFTVIRSETDRLLAEADADYIAGWIDLETLTADYNASGYNSDVVSLRISRAEQQRERTQKKVLREALRDRFLKGDLTSTEFSTELSTLGLSADIVTAAIKEANAHKLKKVSEDTTATHKSLTESAYSRAYKLGLLTLSAYKTKLASLKYDDEDIALLVAMNEPSAPTAAELPTLTMGELKGAYRAGVLTENAIRTELASRLYTQEDINTIVATEKKKIKATTTTA